MPQMMLHDGRRPRPVAAGERVDQQTVLGLGTRASAVRAVEADDERGAGDEVLEEPRQHGVAGDLGEAQVKLAGQPDRLAAVAHGLGDTAGAGVGAQLRQRVRGDAARRRENDRTLDRAPRLEHVVRFVGAGFRDEGAAIGMKRDDAALGEHDQCAADLRAAAVEGVAERGLRKLGAPASFCSMTAATIRSKIASSAGGWRRSSVARGTPFRKTIARSPPDAI